MNRMDEIRELLAYHRWANTAVLDAVEPLPAETVTRDTGSSFPSVRDTLVHMMSAEWAWLERLNGTSPTGMPGTWKTFDIAQVRARWDDVTDALDTWVAKLHDRDLDRTVDYRNLAGVAYTSTIGQILRHVVNHASYHRGQVTTMLRQLGETPPSTDLIRYYRTLAQTPPVA